ncbi:hypothetical protein SAMN05421810_10672 [Amycolatopsis arida]|uniref:Uncharacterized protein n=1 Tax=Amycolatopsis arida TaxID=587909 RepID=A0A1I5XHM1_9PSEU|nr:hypothetical protein [Amycolatopsis arida]TDX97445.1 hypothetical protein CLV69_102549 [Amycolatopsis arida]SFQ31451.1 hypothetical protein SAMN05421810_10672 [Amycolatopsis arida]
MLIAAAAALSVLRRRRRALSVAAGATCVAAGGAPGSVSTPPGVRSARDSKYVVHPRRERLAERVAAGG